MQPGRRPPRRGVRDDRLGRAWPDRRGAPVQLGRGAPAVWSVEAAPSYGAMAACEAYFSRLHLDELFFRVGERRRSVALSDAVFAMVANRLQEPSSTRRCVTNWLGADAVMPAGRLLPSLDCLYRVLDAIAEAKDEIESHC